MWALRTLPAAEWPRLGGYIHRWNLRPDGRVRCLHAEQGASAADETEALSQLEPDGATFIVAEHPAAGGLVGLVGAEVAHELRRAWVRGPLTLDAGGAAADAVRLSLLQALVRSLPEVQRFDAFAQADESALIASCMAAGFHPVQRHHVMRLETPPQEARVAPPESIGAAWAGDPALRELPALHDALFPATYLPGAALVRTLDDDHRLFVARRAGRIAGYVVVQHKRLDAEGYVDYLGVAPDARGSGLGRALLHAAVQWAMVERGLPRMHLTVRQDRAPALGLYEAAGFREVAAGLQLTLQRAGHEADA